VRSLALTPSKQGAGHKGARRAAGRAMLLQAIILPLQLVLAQEVVRALRPCRLRVVVAGLHGLPLPSLGRLLLLLLLLLQLLIRDIDAEQRR
jgi:hypothetical protein